MVTEREVAASDETDTEIVGLQKLGSALVVLNRSFVVAEHHVGVGNTCPHVIGIWSKPQ
jgi:hypothetical protein